MTLTVPLPVQSRLTEAADELFYAQGLRTVSVDKVIDRAGTTKMTFYSHFQGKEDLIVAYLESRAALERNGVDATIAHGDGDVDVSLRPIPEEAGTAACQPGFRGCPFINAAAEHPDPASPVRKVIDAHRVWWTSAFERPVAPLGLPDPTTTAYDLMLLRDGAVITDHLGDPTTITVSFYRSCQAVIRCSGIAAFGL